MVINPEYKQAVLVFLLMVATDVVWAQWSAAVTARRLILGPVMAVMIMLLGAYVTTAYVEDHWMVLPAGAGAALGTWLSIFWEKRKAA